MIWFWGKAITCTHIVWFDPSVMTVIPIHKTYGSSFENVKDTSWIGNALFMYLLAPKIEKDPSS